MIMKGRNLKKGDYIRTYTGKKFYILDPRPEDIDVVDVAHALSLKCRFSGHCKTFYSVAQHSLYVAYGVFSLPDEFNDIKGDLCLWGLLHDLAEAYLPDTPRPIKNMGTGVLQEAEEKIMKIAAKKFNLKPRKQPEIIYLIDNSVGIKECLAIMEGDSQEDWSGYDCINLDKVQIIPMPRPETVERKFLEFFELLK